LGTARTFTASATLISTTKSLIAATRGSRVRSAPKCASALYQRGDDHLQVDLGYLTIVPRECSDRKTGSIESRRPHSPSPPRAVIGLEAEFSLIINGVRERPEKIFGTAQKLIRRKMLPRTGRSFQLPSGGAIYFDTA